MTSADWVTPVWLTLRLATLTTLILFLLGTPLAWWLARTRSLWRIPLSVLVALPLVLPPTVLGFYLLLLLGPHGAIGQFTNSLGWGTLAFTFQGLLIGSILYSAPFVIQPLQNAFESIDKLPLEVAATLGASPIDRFFSVVVPLARSGFWTAAVLGFAHTVGEFGVVLMIGGNIPKQTQVVSIAIYDFVESADYAAAHWLSAGMLGFSFLVLTFLYAFNQRTRKLFT